MHIPAYHASDNGGFLTDIKGVVVAPIGSGKTRLLQTLAEKKTSSRLLNLLPKVSKFKQLRVQEESPEVLDIVANRFTPALMKGDKNELFVAEMDIAKIRFKQFQDLMGESGIWLMERSLFEDRFVFTKNLFRRGLLHPHHYKAYKLYVDSLLNVMPNPDIIIYLRTRPEVSFARMVGRGRECEKGITEDYHKQLFELYEAMMISRLPRLIPNFNRVHLPINANQDLSEEELALFHGDIEHRIELHLKERGFLNNGAEKEESE